MNSNAKAVLTSLILLAVVFPFWACSNESELTAKVTQQVPEGSMKVGCTKVTGSLDVECGDNDYSDVDYHCQVTLKGTVNGQEVTKTVDVVLKTKCAPHKRIRVNCDDPLLVELPLDATGFTCTWFDLAGNSGPMVVTPGLSLVPISPDLNLNAEPGKQLVLIAYPDNLPDGFYNMQLDFSLGYSRPLEVKAAIVARMSCDDVVIYPPIVPCGLTDLATIPPVVIPVAPVYVPIFPPLDGVPDQCTVDVRLCQVPAGVGNQGGAVQPGSWGKIKSLYR